MKVAIRCLNCSKVTRLNKAYSVRLKERTTVILTGEVKEFELIGKMCRDCAELAGYKVRRKDAQKS